MCQDAFDRLLSSLLSHSMILIDNYFFFTIKRDKFRQESEIKFNFLNIE